MNENLILHERACKVLANCGNNPHGQPMYRLVRADSRMEWKTGDYRPKYPKSWGGFWVLETWCDPEKYGDQASWEAADLGPFPRQGDYESVFPLVFDGKPIDPNDGQVEALGKALQKSQQLTRSMRWSFIQQEKERAEEEKRKKLEAMIADAAPLRGGEAVRKYGEEMEEAAKRAPIQPQTPGAGLMV